MKIEKIYGYLVIDGVYYKVDRDKQGAMEFKKQDKKMIEKKVLQARKMAIKLKSSLDGEKVLTETLMSNFDDKSFNKLYTQLFKSKRQYTPKTREHHCVDMKVGNTIIPIVD